jgi:hypothetical protein
VTPATAATVLAALPGGYPDAQGAVQREVEVLAMTGRDEELLAATGTGTVALVTELLTRCVRRIGDIAPVTEDVARHLLVADRQFLMLKVREATFGTSVRSSISCPWADCGRRIDIEFATSAIPVVESVDKGPEYSLSLDVTDAVLADGQAHRELAFRLPNGADQEALSPLLHRNEAAALTGLLGRCVTRIGPVSPAPPELVARLSPRARRSVEWRMTEVAPQIDLTMESTCPECKRNYSVPFEIQSFLFGELRVNTDLLRREIHYLAYHYHWSEREIMEMPRHRRRRYVAQLAEEIERSHDEL